MSRELTRRIEDLEHALRIIRDVAADGALTPKRRLDQIVGITKMHAPAASSDGSASASATLTTAPTPLLENV